MEALGVQLDLVLAGVLRLAAAFLLALPIGWDREKATRESLGLRTFPLVAMASCGFMLIGQEFVTEDPSALARVFAGLITGVGFLGGGAIVKRGLDVHGTATAASIWTTAGIGAAVAFNRYEIAIALSATAFFTLRSLRMLKSHVPLDDEPECGPENDGEKGKAATDESSD